MWGRHWENPSLRSLCLHSSVFPKKRRGELGPGRRRAAITESWQKYHFHTRNLLLNWSGHEQFVLQQKAFLKRNSTGDCIKLTVVSCARPAQRYVGTTMDRIIIEKATWWTGRRRRLSRFFFFLFLNTRLNLALVKKALREQKSDCSIVRDIYFLPFPCLISVKTLVQGKKQNRRNPDMGEGYCIQMSTSHKL